MSKASDRFKVRLSVMRGAIMVEIRERIERKGKEGRHTSNKTIQLKEPMGIRNQFDIHSLTAGFMEDKDGYQYSYETLTVEELIDLLEVISPRTLTPVEEMQKKSQKEVTPINKPEYIVI